MYINTTYAYRDYRVSGIVCFYSHLIYIYSPLDFQHRNGNPTRLPRGDPGDPHRVSVEAVSLTNLEVIEIVSWGDFQCTSAKPHLVGG